MSLGLRIPFNGLQKQYSNLRHEILDVTDQVLRSGQVMNGNFTVEFEHWLAKRNHVQYAVTCHSGTQALEIIAEYYREHTHRFNTPRVLMPSVTYPATANAFIRAGWDIHFVDVDRYGIIDFTKLPELVGYDAICIVGLYGAAIPHSTSAWRMMNRASFLIIEDAAQHWLSADCTRLGQATAISFDPTKNLGNFGNGGAVLTNDQTLSYYARDWRDNGKIGNFETSGTNSRMSEVDCVQMLVKATHIDQWQKRREMIARHWMDRLRNSEIRCLIDKSNVDEHCFHKFVIECDHRDGVKRKMGIRGIDTRIHYELPLHELSAYRQFPGPDMLSPSSALCRRVLSLPIYSELTDLEVEYIIDQLLDSYAETHN